MALITNEQYQSNTPNTVPPVDAHVIQPKVLEADAAAPTLQRLTMMAFNTSTGFWGAWDPAGINGLDDFKGLLWPDEVDLDAADEVIAQMLISGRVRREDVVVSPSVTATSGQIDDELRAKARNLGIYVQNLTEVR